MVGGFWQDAQGHAAGGVDDDRADDEPLGEVFMKVLRIAARVARLLVAAPIAVVALQGRAAEGDAPAADVSSFSLGKSAIDADELRELNTQPDPEKRRRLDAVLEAHPQDLAARFLRLQLEVKLGEDSAMLSDSEVVLENPALVETARLWVLEWRAEALVHAGHAAEAVLAADQALAIKEASSGALFARGWARFQQDRVQTDGALADLNRALELVPGEGVGHYRRAVVLQARGELDRATRDYELAVQLAPRDVPSHREYGILLYQTHALERALAQFEAARNLAPHDPDVWVWQMQAELALARSADVAADERRIDELGATRAQVAYAFRQVADALEDQLDFAGAERLYGRSLALAPEPAVAYWLARMQWFNGHFDQPVAYFRERAMAAKSDAYMAIWLFVARSRANPADEVAAHAELAHLAPPHEPHEWTDTLVSMLLGSTSLDAALVEADAAPTFKLKAGRRCEADYYAAEALLMHGGTDAASRLLQEAYWVCPSTYVEAHAVIAQRRLLEAGSPSH